MASTGNASIATLTANLQRLLKVAQDFRATLTRTRQSIQRLHTALDTVRVADEALKMLNAALKAVKAACEALSAVPYVGLVFKVAGQVVDVLQKAVDQVSKVVSRVEKQVKPRRDKLPPVIERLQKVEKLGTRFEGRVGKELGNARETDQALARAPKSRYRKAAEDEYAKGAEAISPALSDQSVFLADGTKTLGSIMKSIDVLEQLIDVVAEPVEPISKCTQELEDKLPSLRNLQETLGKKIFMGLTPLEILEGGMPGSAAVRKVGEKLVMERLQPLIKNALPSPSVGPAAILALPGTFLRIASVLETMFSTTTGLLPKLEERLSDSTQASLFAAIPE